jgi:sulfite reductase alpha subunit-like flavoprotein
VKALIADGKAREWIAGRHLVDLIETFPVKLDAAQLRALTRPLASRAYSIASSRREVGDEAHATKPTAASAKASRRISSPNASSAAARSK